MIREWSDCVMSLAARGFEERRTTARGLDRQWINNFYRDISSSERVRYRVKPREAKIRTCNILFIKETIKVRL